MMNLLQNLIIYFISLNFLFNVAKVAISKNSGFKKSFDGL